MNVFGTWINALLPILESFHRWSSSMNVFGIWINALIPFIILELKFRRKKNTLFGQRSSWCFFLSRISYLSWWDEGGGGKNKWELRKHISKESNALPCHSRFFYFMKTFDPSWLFFWLWGGTQCVKLHFFGPKIQVDENAFQKVNMEFSAKINYF